jgi:UDP-N-acetylmuramate--alanine ligase
MIGLLMKGRHGLAIAGTHGKSTTTAMAAEILSAAGCDPTVIYGAVPCRECDRITPALTPCPLRAPCTHGHGRGELVLVEACEFQQNFLNLCPHDAVILNIEPDHFDCYETGDELEAAFARFAALLPADGRLIIPAADLAVRRAAASAACRIETFGWHQLADHSPAPNWSAANARNDCGHYGFDLLRCGEELGRIELSVYGRHNVLNALAAAALTAGCGASADAIIRGLSRFCGLRRRLEPLGAVGGISFWDDYAHHPSAISTTLQTLREAAPGARIWCLFQPHQALRTARLLDELAFSLQNAERVLIADIFRAREGPPKTGEVTAGDLAERTRALGQDVPGLHAPVDIQQFLQTRLTPGDVLVVMGAGDIGRIGYGLMDWFRKHRAAR